MALLRAKHSTGRLACWAGIIAELDLDIKYRPGQAKVNADALSHSPLLTKESDGVAPDMLMVMKALLTFQWTPAVVSLSRCRLKMSSYSRLGVIYLKVSCL